LYPLHVLLPIGVILWCGLLAGLFWYKLTDVSEEQIASIATVFAAFLLAFSVYTLTMNMKVISSYETSVNF
jgi:succinate-acetate transporter protein